MATSLQNIRATRLALIEERIKQYELRFPVAKIAELTGYHKGHVSKILAGKSDISEDFMHKFDSAFPNKLLKGNFSEEVKQLSIDHPVPPPTDLAALYKEIVAEKEARRQEAETRLKKEEDRYDKLFLLLETNLKELYTRSLEILQAQYAEIGYQKFWVEKWAEREAGGNKEKAKKLATAYRREVAEMIMGKPKDHIPSDQGN